MFLCSEELGRSLRLREWKSANEAQRIDSSERAHAEVYFAADVITRFFLIPYSFPLIDTARFKAALLCLPEQTPP